MIILVSEWLYEVGEKYTSIFWKNITLKYILQAVWTFIIFLFSFFSMLFVRMNLNNISAECGVLTKKRNIFVISALISFIFSSVFSENMFQQYMMFTDGGVFNLQDPVFNKDIGYYVFQRPFLISIAGSFHSIWLIIMLVVFAAYFVFMSMFGNYSF